MRHLASPSATLDFGGGFKKIFGLPVQNARGMRVFSVQCCCPPSVACRLTKCTFRSTSNLPITPISPDLLIRPLVLAIQKQSIQSPHRRSRPTFLVPARRAFQARPPKFRRNRLRYRDHPRSTQNIPNKKSYKNLPFLLVIYQVSDDMPTQSFSFDRIVTPSGGCSGGVTVVSICWRKHLAYLLVIFGSHGSSLWGQSALLHALVTSSCLSDMPRMALDM